MTRKDWIKLRKMIERKHKLDCSGMTEHQLASILKGIDDYYFNQQDIIKI